MAKAKRPIPEGLHTVTPQLVLENAAQTIAWYVKAFDAKETARALGPDGKILHAEVQIGNSRFFVNDAMMGAKTAKGFGGSPVSFWIYVEDCDALFKRAKGAGAKGAPGPMGDMQDQFWGDRSGTVIDPEGITWTIATHKEDLTPDEMKKRQDEWMKNFAKQSGGAKKQPA